MRTNTQNLKSSFARFVCVASAVSMLTLATSAFAIPEEPQDWPGGEETPQENGNTWSNSGKDVQMNLIEDDPIEFPQEPGGGGETDGPTYSIFSSLLAALLAAF